MKYHLILIENFLECICECACVLCICCIWMRFIHKSQWDTFFENARNWTRRFITYYMHEYDNNCIGIGPLSLSLELTEHIPIYIKIHAYNIVGRMSILEMKIVELSIHPMLHDHYQLSHLTSLIVVACLNARAPHRFRNLGRYPTQMECGSIIQTK